MGWTPMVRVMAYWFPVASRGKTMGLLGTCYQLGASLAGWGAGILIGRQGYQFTFGIFGIVAFVGPQPLRRQDGSVEDHWGVPRVRVEVPSGKQSSVYHEVRDSPLRDAHSVREILDYSKWPRIDWFDFDCVARQVADARRTGKTVVFIGDRLNRCAQLKPAMYLRGMDQILVDLALNPQIADMIDCGLDILNPIQPHVADMDRRQLKREFGQRLCFHGSISIQKTLPFGTPDDVRREVAERFQTLGPQGGFIFCTAHNIQADTPVANIEALFEAYKTHGRY